MQLTYTFFPGLHGTSALFTPLVEALGDVPIELINYPTDISQSYDSLLDWTSKNIDWTIPRSLVAESFSGPLALRIAELQSHSVRALTLAASFCASPTNPSLALLPLRPLMLLRPTKGALRHFLIGEEASEQEVEELRNTVRSIPAKILSQRIRAILSLEENQCPKLENLPIQILQAQNDTMIHWEAQNQLRMQYEHATTHWLDAPHLILQTHPRECAILIKEFSTQQIAHYA
ncbi:alpha/beta fold hydrolase [Rubritalea spongiae]|uniref:Alpha/beta fold hydrolase n=1 Tax=Rubritalea spongiae TaxID=430797 RepID=A0ABW5E5A9_9BACT